MPNIQEFASILQMSPEDMVSIGERQAVDPQSNIYRSIKLDFAKKMSAVKQVADTAVQKREASRVYVPYTVEPAQRYVLIGAVPQWELVFTNVLASSAPMYRAARLLLGEYLLSKVKRRRGDVVAYGISMSEIVLRSRHWVHLCVPGFDVAAQHAFYMDDRAICAIVNANTRQGKSTGLSAGYISGSTRLHCTVPGGCTKHAIAGIMMLNDTDTNFRQLAYYMLQHKVSLLYFAIPACKHLELCTQGEFSELDAYVQPTDDGSRVDLIFKNDMACNMSWDYANYLELIARTEVRVGNMVFRKEFESRILGHNVYKVTAFPCENVKDTIAEYRSWVEPEFMNHYMVYAPVLKPHGNSSLTSDWSMVSFPVKREVIDDVHDAAMRAQGIPDLAGFIQRRLASKSSNVIILNQIVQKNKLLAVTRFDLVAFVIFISVFVNKYKDGQAVSALAPQARQVANIQQRGFLGLLSEYTSTVSTSASAAWSKYVGALRGLYYTLDAQHDLPMPSFAIEPGFVTYSQDSSSNPRFKGWHSDSDDPTRGFSPKLPGYGFKSVLETLSVSDTRSQTVLSGMTDDPVAFAYGEAFMDVSGPSLQSVQQANRRMKYSDDGPLWNMVTSFAKTVYSLAEHAEEATYELVNEEKKGVVVGEQFYEPSDTVAGTLVFDKSQGTRFASKAPDVRQIVDKVLNDNGRLANLPHTYVATEVFAVDGPPDIIPGLRSDAPAIDLKDGLGTIFPGSLLMDTVFFEGEKLYGDMDLSMKTVKMKMDMTRLAPLKPEKFYLPMIKGHVLPDAKGNMTNVLYSMVKRNANTPDNTLPMDEDRLVEGAFRDYLKVYCKEDMGDWLSAQPYIGPDERTVTEWVSRLDEPKKKKLASQDDYDPVDLDLAQNTLMLKGRIKPNLGASYDTAVQMPQTIQFDQSNKSTAVLSPVIGHKVEREQHMLKHNVLVLQRKSIADINKFLNGFDWRPNELGKRYYLEGDYTKYDKSQGVVASKLHWHKCAKFGIMPNLVAFLRDHNMERSISAVEAGVKMFLNVQRGSGHPDTLDGNNDVNELAMASLLLQIIDQIEFIILMGDDFIVAVRGMVDLTNWESEVARRFNLELKLSLHEHGYICSYDIVHYPDGHTRVVADVIKRSLSFLTVSNKDEQLFPEKFVSFVDNMQGIQDARVQTYLSQAIPQRIKSYLPGVTPEAILLLCKATTALMTDYAQFRGMFSDVPTLINY